MMSRNWWAAAGAVLMAMVAGTAHAEAGDSSAGDRLHDGLGLVSLPAAEGAWDPASDGEGPDPTDLMARVVHEGITPQEAETRFQREVVAVLVQRYARDAWGTAFAGVWIDYRGDFSIVAAVADDSDLAQRRSELLDAVPGVDRLRVIRHTHSLAALERARDAILREGKASSTGDGNPAAPESLRAKGGVFGVGVDVVSNEVTLDVDGATGTLRDDLEEAYAVPIALSEGAGGQEACTINNCRPQANGGLKLFRSGGGYCTSGFNAYASGKRYLLSAGHCTLASGGSIGRTHIRHYGWTSSADGGRAIYEGRVDAERIALNPSQLGRWDHTNRIRLDGTNTRAITSWINNADFVVGTYIGKTGATSDTSRGYTTHVGYSPSWVPNALPWFIRADYCAENGDSGGAVFRNGTAYGIHSGGSGYSCPSTSDWSAFSTIHTALHDMGVNLQLSNYNDPPVAAFSISCGMLMECTFNAGSSFDIDGSISSYQWNFGDGSTGSGAVVTHRYLLPGTYDVRLTVRDNGARTNSRTQTATASWVLS